MNTRTITTKVRYYVDAFADETCIEHDIWFTYPQMQKHVEKLKAHYQEKHDFDSIRIRLIIFTEPPKVIEETWLDL